MCVAICRQSEDEAKRKQQCENAIENQKRKQKRMYWVEVRREEYEKGCLLIQRYSTNEFWIWLWDDENRRLRSRKGFACWVVNSEYIHSDAVSVKKEVQRKQRIGLTLLGNLGSHFLLFWTRARERVYILWNVSLCTRIKGRDVRHNGWIAWIQRHVEWRKYPKML